MSKLAHLSPELLWKHFEALSRIPRVSQNEKAAGDYVLDQARKWGLPAKRDDAGNIVVTKPATPGYENRQKAILQGHLDMVGQKTSGSAHDFAKDPIQLVLDGDWLHAKDTTLGADNGIGVSAALAILESKDIPHGPLAALFTVEEEIGLLGAAKVPKEFLDGDVLLNMDGDSPEELTIGCAGAADVRASVPATRTDAPADWTAIKLTLGGLTGGHSGVDIHKGRGNALKLLARIIADACEKDEIRLLAFAGGSARNAIPRDASASFFCDKAAASRLKKALHQAFSEVAHELSATEKGISLLVEETAERGKPVDAAASRRFLTLLRTYPTGVIRMSDAHQNVVETSSNLGIAVLEADGTLTLQSLIRSLVDSAKMDTAHTAAALVRLAGGTAVIHGNYPGWEPAKESAITALYAETTKKVLGKTPSIAVIHAGLECGIVRAIKPSLDCISSGALIHAMHSPDERVSVKSAAQLFEIVCTVLKNLPERKA